MKYVNQELGRAQLIVRFAAAGLLLEITGEPIGTTNRDIFGMDIQRRIKNNWRTEYFRIWPGHAESRIEVQGTDATLSQLVLMVHEPARSFELRVGKRSVARVDPRIVRDDGPKHVILREETRDSKRHYLCGVDERQLFIAELPRGVSTVRQAHRVLKAEEVILAEGRRKVKRQGEWFFVELTAEEHQQLITALNAGAIRLYKQPIGQGGHPHTADELLRLPGKRLEHGHPVRPQETFVRGKVRHIDHKTVELLQWHKVIRNTEPNAGRMAGIAWID